MKELNEDILKAISDLATYIQDTEAHDYHEQLKENGGENHIYPVAQKVAEWLNPTIWCCPDCGSEDVHETAWLDVNTGEMISGGLDGPLDRFWCEGCESEIKGLVKKE
jgi:hypothetical protein